jgi:hypothetical protein
MENGQNSSMSPQKLIIGLITRPERLLGSILFHKSGEGGGWEGFDEREGRE